MVYQSTRMKGHLLQIKANNTVNSRIDFKLTGFIVIRGLKYRRSLKFHIGIKNTTSCFVLVKDGSTGSRNCWWERYYTIPKIEENNEPKIWSFVWTKPYLGISLEGSEGWKFHINSESPVWRWNLTSLAFFTTDNATLAYRILSFGN